MTELVSLDIRLAAMNLLAQREYGHVELVVKLRSRFQKIAPSSTHADLEEIIEREVDRLKFAGLQNDQRLVEVFIRSKARRGQGPVKISAALHAKGIDFSIVKQGFELCDVDWAALAANVVAKKQYGDSTCDLDVAELTIKDKLKIQRFLKQRGFTYEQIDSLGLDH